MKFINKIIKDLPIGASALVEERINHKDITLIVIKDRFKNLIDAPWVMELHFKGGVIRKRKTLVAHLLINIKDNLNEKFYPFHFNYFDENSLKLLYNLTKQKEIYIIISDENNNYISKTFNNKLGVFLKNYINSSINFGYKWSEVEYKKALMETIEAFQDIRQLWNKLGGEIYL